MCGFVFFHSSDGIPPSKAQISNSLSSLESRGPDDIRAFAISNTGKIYKQLCISDLFDVIKTESIATLGLHARLAITGSQHAISCQPYFNVNTGEFLLFNGEIYNYKELAKQYFLGDELAFISDTYLLSLLVGKFGLKAFDYLDGIYSVVIFSTLSKAVYALKDPIGAKPLYYHVSDTHIVYGSTLKACASFSRVKLFLNRSACNHFLKSGRLTRANQTLIDGYLKLPSGSYISNNLSMPSSVSNPLSWFDYDSLFSLNRSCICTHESASIVDSIIRQAPPIPYGILLSAGIDSSVIALQCSKIKSSIIACFTGKTINKIDDECDIARKTASSLNVSHFVVSPCSDDFSPVLTQFISSTYSLLPSHSHLLELFLYKKISEAGIKVILAGHGADELFEGYTLVFPMLIFIDCIMSFRFAAAFRYLSNYYNQIVSLFAICLSIKSLLSAYSAVLRFFFCPGSLRFRFFHKIKVLFSPLLCLKFFYLFLDSQLQAQVEPTDLASMNFSLECRIPLISIPLLKRNFINRPSSSGILKFSLRSILSSDHRTFSLSSPIAKKGFQYSYTPSTSGPFSERLSDKRLRLLCLDILRKEIATLQL